CLAQDDVIENPVRIILQAMIDIALINRNTPGDCALYALSVQLDPACFHSLVLLQPREQFAIAATQIEYACLWLDQFADDCVIRTAEYTMDKWTVPKLGRIGRHARATISRQVLARKPRMSSVSSATSTRNASCP